MINPLKVATSGYLKRTTKAVLVIAVAGYLNFGGTPPNPPSGGGGGGDKYSNEGYRDSGKEQQELKERILREDSELIAIVQLCLKTTII